MQFTDVIERVFRYLMPRPGIAVKVTSNYTAGATSLDLDQTSDSFPSVRPGTMLAVDIELFYVLAVNTSTGVCTVIPGYAGSAEANHASGVLAYPNPRFSRFDISQSINDVIGALSAPDNGLGQIIPILVTYIPVFAGYDLTSQFDGATSKVLGISFKIAPPIRTYPPIRRGDYRVIRGQSATQSDFPSGNGLIIYKEAWPGFPITVVTLAPFTPLVNLTDDLLTVGGIPVVAQDIVALGAMIRLAPDREIQRNTLGAQQDPRKAPEVPAGGMQNATTKLEKRFQDRIDEERSRLVRAWPEMEWR